MGFEIRSYGIRRLDYGIVERKVLSEKPEKKHVQRINKAGDIVSQNEIKLLIFEENLHFFSIS